MGSLPGLCPRPGRRTGSHPQARHALRRLAPASPARHPGHLVAGEARQHAAAGGRFGKQPDGRDLPQPGQPLHPTPRHGGRTPRPHPPSHPGRQVVHHRRTPEELLPAAGRRLPQASGRHHGSETDRAGHHHRHHPLRLQPRRHARPPARQHRKRHAAICLAPPPTHQRAGRKAVGQRHRAEQQGDPAAGNHRGGRATPPGSGKPRGTPHAAGGRHHDGRHRHSGRATGHHLFHHRMAGHHAEQPLPPRTGKGQTKSRRSACVPGKTDAHRHPRHQGTRRLHHGLY